MVHQGAWEAVTLWADLSFIQRSLFLRYKNKLHPPKPLQIYRKVESWEYIESIDNEFIFHHCAQDCSLNQLQSLDRQVPGRVPLNHFCRIFVIFFWHTWILPVSDPSICRQNCYCCPRPECSSDKVVWGHCFLLPVTMNMWVPQLLLNEITNLVLVSAFSCFQETILQHAFSRLHSNKNHLQFPLKDLLFGK